MGTRWQGTLNTGDPSSSTLTACCPAAKSGQGRTCDCSAANADPSAYSDEYRTFLRDWANAQITAFDRGWGWFYWTWDTESAPLWSWKKGLAAGILPKTPGQGREGYKCEGDPEDYGANGLPETY